MSSVSLHDAIHHRSRMKSEDRRELILDAALGVFGDFGYVGATTDQVARAAGVSQPYVVRMFGTKERLFLEALDRAVTRLHVVFRAAIADTLNPMNLHERVGRAYVDLVSDRGLLLTMMHAFVLGSDPVIGRASRDCFLSVYTMLRDEAGFTPAEVHAFLAQGMLINTLVGLRMSDDFESNPVAAEMLSTALPNKLDVVLTLGAEQRAEAR
jgi:AcrR family transcriptional regulator